MKKTILTLCTAFFIGGNSFGQGKFAIELTNGMQVRTDSSMITLDNNSAVNGFKPEEIRMIRRAKEADFSFKADNVTSYSATLSAVPKDSSMTYYTAIEKKAVFDLWPSQDSVIASNRNVWDAWAQAYDITREDFLTQSLQYEAINNDEVLDLKANTDYVIYAYGYTAKDEILTTVSSYVFKTAPIDHVNVSFSIDTITRGNVVDFTIRPSDNSVRYYFDVLSDDDIAYYGNGDLRTAIENYIETFYGFFNLTAHEFYDNMTKSGEYAITMDWLTSDTHYTAFAIAVDRGMQITSTEISTIDFNTKTPGKSDNKIDVSVYNISSTNAIISTQPSNSDKYVLYITTKDELNGMNDDEIVAYLEEKHTPYYLDFLYSYDRANTTFLSKAIENVKPGTEYSVVVFGYQLESLSHSAKGIRTTELQRIDFSTLSKPQTSAEMSFYFYGEAYNGYGIAALVYPSEPTPTYYSGMFEASLTEDEVKQKIDEMAKRENKTTQQYLLANSHSGEWMHEAYFENNAILPDVSYRIAAVGITNDGDYAQSFSFSESFTASATPDEEYMAAKQNKAKRLYARGSSVKEDLRKNFLREK